ncbi:MAG: sigma-70 family RNA polymerase sigma factor [Candidatus Poribacteria bacterium]|nr:sigma-70 family RNA polymerase sigma factor [Candidatus Poribacteria bacterium]
MKNDDVALIRRILTGDETAFAELVKKYQKQVHVLAWRKTGDFHIAEDLTQDAFLKVYQRLHTLKDPYQFSGWLYVITTRLCATWLRKNRIHTHPLENVDSTMIQRDAYSQHIAEERENTAVETQREVVKKLLAKLKESERTVMTLHYLGEMTCEEISKFLGVSTGTIKSRLQRARNRLQKDGTMIREALDNFKISPHLTDNIMQEIAQLKPAVPSITKPLLPWVAAVSSAVLIMLMLGIGSQHFLHFQIPYSLNAQAETTVELVDAPFVLNIETEPDVRQFGNQNALGKTNNNGQIPDEDLLAAAQTEGEDISIAKQPWIQSKQIRGSKVESLFTTPEGEFYAFTDRNIYKLETDAEEWRHVFDTTLLDTNYEGETVIKKFDNTLYLILSTDLFASRDDGKTWNLVYSWQEGLWFPTELVLTKQAFYILFYLGNNALQTNDLFRSVDSGKTWKVINNNQIDRHIHSIVPIQNTLFARTEYALYRFTDENWQRIEFPVSVGRISSVAVAEEKLYVMAAASDDVLDTGKVSQGLERGWWIFRSTDLGDSWDDITPTNAWVVNGLPPRIKLIAIGETLLAMEQGMVRSTDSGNTWLPPQLSNPTPSFDISPDVIFKTAVNEGAFYISGRNGLHRSIDNGKSWNKVNITADKIKIDALIAYKGNKKRHNTPPTLYARYEGRIAKTSDEGKSWHAIQIEMPMTDPDREKPPDITHIIKAEGVLYAKGGGSFTRGKTHIYRVSTEGNILVPIQGLPIFDSLDLLGKSDEIIKNQFNESDKSVIEQLQEKIPGANQFFKQVAQSDRKNLFHLFSHAQRSPFVVSGDTFYMEINYKLYRWKLGETEWQETGQEETCELTLEIAEKTPKLAVSGDSICYGKRDGSLVISFDKGNNWIDLTPALPFTVNAFKDIVFIKSTVYVVTDTGIITSDNGRNWHTITDADGTNLIMEHLSADGTTLYGISKDTGIYRLETGKWKQVVSEIPNNVTSLTVDGNTLYVGTQDSGMFHYTLEQ